MTENPTRFAELLTRAINRIHADENKPKTIIRDELGYAAGREGRTAIDYWRRDGGHIPAELESVEGLARAVARRWGLNAVEMAAFLAAACHPDAKRLCGELYPDDRRDSDALINISPPLLQAFDDDPEIAVHAASAWLPNDLQVRRPMPDEARLKSGEAVATTSAGTR